MRETLDEGVREYFSALTLPDRVTLYDELILCLRDKDLIAPFNWDPLLLQAYHRVAAVGSAPRIVFLHGNVAVGYCERDRVAGNLGQNCGKCGARLAPSPLLYPVKDKRYRDHPFLAAQWAELEEKFAGGLSTHDLRLQRSGLRRCGREPAASGLGREIARVVWLR